MAKVIAVAMVMALGGCSGDDREQSPSEGGAGMASDPMAAERYRPEWDCTMCAPICDSVGDLYCKGPRIVDGVSDPPWCWWCVTEGGTCLSHGITGDWFPVTDETVMAAREGYAPLGMGIPESVVQEHGTAKCVRPVP